MDIAALAMSMKHTGLMQDVSLAMTKKVMEFQQENAEQIVEVIDASHPVLGKLIDISV
ncbi:YjfB family protein [Solibacillus isronensis]|uniref:YjfB family protein n=1 Tax=Solibacillus isronensis TaxID=412383 RepID=UPI00203CDA9F|nr:YjfB family protein [Solibacillus isronensis]MCM3720662.1 YjfB family protein [Solibacillus isronensis]